MTAESGSTTPLYVRAAELRRGGVDRPAIARMLGRTIVHVDTMLHHARRRGLSTEPIGPAANAAAMREAAMMRGVRFEDDPAAGRWEPRFRGTAMTGIGRATSLVGEHGVRR